MSALIDHMVAVGATWQRYCVALDLIRRNGMTDDGLRELVDAKNAHVMALDSATLAALKVAHGPVLERAKARAARAVRP